MEKHVNICLWLSLPLLLPFRFGLLIAGMAVKGPGRCELAQLMAHHVLGDKDGNEFLAIVYSESQTDELGYNGGPPRPGFNDFSITRFPGLGHLLDQVIINKWTFFERARHLFLLKINSWRLAFGSL